MFVHVLFPSDNERIRRSRPQTCDALFRNSLLTKLKTYPSQKKHRKGEGAYDLDATAWFGL